MLIMCPFFDDLSNLIAFKYTPACIFRIALSCLFAIGVNITNYLVIGKTSPLTYQVLGHLKTILILILGFLMFNKHVDARNLIGIIVAMSGVVWYTEVRRKETGVSQKVSKNFSKSYSDDENIDTEAGLGSYANDIEKVNLLKAEAMLKSSTRIGSKDDNNLKV